jgi:hypothetical protein
MIFALQYQQSWREPGGLNGQAVASRIKKERTACMFFGHGS